MSGISRGGISREIPSKVIHHVKGFSESLGYMGVSVSSWRGTPSSHLFLGGIFHEINQPFWIPPWRAGNLHMHQKTGRLTDGPLVRPLVTRRLELVVGNIIYSFHQKTSNRQRPAATHVITRKGLGTWIPQEKPIDLTNTIHQHCPR